MPLTLEQLRTPITEDAGTQTVLDVLSALGFNATSWQSGSLQRTLVQMVGNIVSTMSQTADSLSRMAFNATSQDGALTSFAASQYDNERIHASSTVGTVVLTGGTVGPPHVFVASDLVVSNGAGITFRNTTGGTIGVSSTLSVTFQAETPGAASNVANNTITIINTPLAGVTVNNPDPGSGSWITTLGVDEESNPSLRLRNISKWGTLSPSDPLDRYENLIRTAVPTAPRVAFNDANPAGPGTLHGFIAGAAGAATGADVVASQTEADRIKNPTADVTMFAAPAQAQAFVATVHILAANNNAATQSAVSQALVDYTNDLRIGGTVFPPSVLGEWVLSEAVGAMTAITGIEQVVFSTPAAANVTIAAFNVMTVSGSPTLTFVTV